MHDVELNDLVISRSPRNGHQATLDHVANGQGDVMFGVHSFPTPLHGTQDEFAVEENAHTHFGSSDGESSSTTTLELEEPFVTRGLGAP